MTTKLRLILILIWTMLAQAACTARPATSTDSTTTITTSTPTAAITRTAAALEDVCPTPSTDTNLLTNAEAGYCLLYPAEYSTDVPNFIVINPVPGPGDVLGDAWVSIGTENAAGRTAAQAADAEIAFAGEGFNITRAELIVDGEPAIIVDGLPGPDAWRKVYVVHGERLYTLTFLPWQPTQGVSAPTPLENLYTAITDSLHFLPPTKPLPTPTQPWGPDNLPPALVFVTPLDGQVLAFEGDYFFQVNDIGADGYLWSFSQNGEVVWENLRDELGYTSGGTYAILAGSAGHDRFVPGPVQVSVRAVQGQYLAEPAVITIILQ